MRRNPLLRREVLWEELADRDAEARDHVLSVQLVVVDQCSLRSAWAEHIHRAFGRREDPDQPHSSVQVLLHLIDRVVGAVSRAHDLYGKVGRDRGDAADGDTARGRDVFFSRKAGCGSCHRIGSEGAPVGPDLSKIGAIRQPRDLLESIVFPSVSFARGYEPYAIVTDDGRVLNGIIARETSHEIVLRMTDLSEVRVRRSQIDEMQQGRTSIMPQGLETRLSPEELRTLLTSTDWDDLFGFSSFRYKNIRRKDDARDFPSRIEFGLRRGLSLPVSLNTGQQIDFMLARIAGMPQNRLPELLPWNWHRAAEAAA